MHSFEVHSNESACRKSGCLGLEQVIIPVHNHFPVVVELLLSEVLEGLYLHFQCLVVQNNLILEVHILNLYLLYLLKDFLLPSVLFTMNESRTQLCLFSRLIK